jgi:hypothetical protein
MWWLVPGFIVLLLVYVNSRPDQFRIERVALVNAAPETVHALIDDFHAWKDWSPWANIDPAMQVIHSGATHGVGAVYEWQGNNKVGQGRMEILASTQTLLRIKLDFFKPFEAHNLAEFTLEPQGSGTRITWAMFGPNFFMSKLMSVVFNMDKMVGKDFEKGLASLKALAERG